MIPSVIEALREAGGAEIPVVLGGIIPTLTSSPFAQRGVAAVYTPKDFELTRILRDIVGLVAERNGNRHRGGVTGSGAELGPVCASAT